MGGLTEDQALVAQSDGYTMCCALPGSGKSHTIVELTKNLLAKNKTNKVLLITFTRAAAAELTERLNVKLGDQAYRAKASTFDSIYGQQVKTLNEKRKKRTLVGGEQYNFIERAIRYCSLNGMKMEDALGHIDYYGRMIDPKPINDDETAESWQVYSSYMSLLAQNNMQDFNVIAREAYLGVETGRIAPWDCTHMLVDEFQDTSDMQYAWIRVHGEAGIKITVVGDDDQSIYSWRGALGFENMVMFQQDFNAKGYVLRKCFRCRPEILASARTIIEFNSERVYKEMESAREEGGIVKVHGYLSEVDELDAMIQAIKANNKQWAILSRTNKILDKAEAMLKVNEIPYIRLGSKNLWDDNVANIFLKIIWSIIRPKDKRFIGEILGWLGEDEQDIQLISRAMTYFKGSFGEWMPDETLQWSSVSQTLHEKWIPFGIDCSGKILIEGRVKQLLDLLKEARGNKGSEAKFLDILGGIIIGMKDELSFCERVEILAKNLAPSKDGNNEDDVETGVVTLSSLHSSKGLQWAQVWMLASNQGICPSTRALDEGEAAVSEERRLFYVGMTRAVDELRLSFTFNPLQGTGERKPPSQFLGEGFPERTLEIIEQLKKQNANQTTND
ncbi:ATP-dependent helicase [Photobacterium damselae]|uniref:ATP-dependent helicase n=1 Tax=Photobacterium damselae TaxID=38293 RepID=UPI00370A031E